MTEHKKFKRPKYQPASIDGIVVGTRAQGLGGPTVSSYQPNRTSETPSLGIFSRRTDGFHANRQTPSRLGQINAESAETAALLDEPIVLDDESSKKKKQHYFGHKHPRLRKILKRSGLLTAVLVIGVGGFLFIKLEHDLAKVFHGNIFSVFHPATKLKGEDQDQKSVV